MALLSSKTLIQGHALFLFLLAVYLTKSPNIIIESDLVFMLGELLHIDAAPSFSRPQSPFALCGILLVADALVDLVLITKIPTINEIIATAEASRYQSSVTTPGVMRANPFVTRLATLYSEIWTLLSASRFCLFFAVSFFVYQSNPVAWGVETGSGLDQLKNRVVFTYGFMEMMFWLWIYLTLREERQELVSRFVGHDE
ncbi:uncharacterized protein EURHEDRAFT_490387 [Aspergillus ruber CBS 135680]|uniref:Increased loss of mitochondrial DNA protein 1 n=1 Tax=Aspergillus ruber (strain CBS 135680) TaxID=1388766 RepID=A0A017SRB0_ASPRC|nr:uncharacterized protein EURHEDRAFT_490387 [Aspergillus ruber CBS 135680]EYE99498.1 hypothetical protein EURHEDRAFT_490387 [Aspergillus ruber CBS 135680]